MTVQPNSMFERIGGLPVIERLVEAFYAQMDCPPEAKAIREMHAPDLALTRRTLKRYLTGWIGGPTLYSEERGHPRLRQRHMGFPIGNAERDAWLLRMEAALLEAVIDTEARTEIHAAMAKLANWMRNREGRCRSCWRHARIIQPPRRSLMTFRSGKGLFDHSLPRLRPPH